MGSALGSGSGDGDRGRYLGAFLEPELAELGQNWRQQVRKRVVKDDSISVLYSRASF